jgi:hypothetical protein
VSEELQFAKIDESAKRNKKMKPDKRLIIIFEGQINVQIQDG